MLLTHDSSRPSLVTMLAHLAFSSCDLELQPRPFNLTLQTLDPGTEVPDPGVDLTSPSGRV